MTIHDYLKLPYRLELVEDPDEGGYVASYPELPGCITCGETIERAAENAREAKREWLEATMAEGLAIAQPEQLDTYSGQFKLRMPKRLHRSLAEHAKREGISMNQYCLYLLTMHDSMVTGR